jgi:molybdopterin molybdotransferase
MISPEEADSLIRDALPECRDEQVKLEEAAGRILREEVRDPRPSPPFNRATMDGIALSFAAWADGIRSFVLEGTQAAGLPAQTLRQRGGCWEIMTGAAIPAGCDTVIPIEEIAMEEGRAVVSPAAIPQQGEFIHRRESDHPAGFVLLRPGVRLGAREIAAAASAGYARLRVSVAPRVAVVASGDELVCPGSPVADHQIYLSNNFAIQAALMTSGCPAVTTHHLKDDLDQVLAGLRAISGQADVVILSGGVSKGRFDYIHAALEQLRVQRIFHGVRQRPGKPFWFGVTENGRPVFALPGNPLSTLVCLHRYVLPALERMMGMDTPPAIHARLASPVEFRPPLTWFLPVKISSLTGELRAEPVPPNTSGDYTSVLTTHGFIELPSRPTDFPAGFPAPFRPWR